jgi:hypothetical protein
MDLISTTNHDRPGPLIKALLSFGRRIRQDQVRLAPKDFIDIQSFIWVQGSSEYDE